MDEDVDIILYKGICKCGNNNIQQFWKMRDTNYKQIVGICCKIKKCSAEYLIDRPTVDSKPHLTIFNYDEYIDLYHKSPAHVKMDPSFQVMLSRERVTDMNDLRPGDHVGFGRSYWIWHHGIVVEVQSNPFIFVVDGWDFAEGSHKMQKRRKELGPEDVNMCYVFKYSEELERENPPELVLARSESRLHPAGQDAGFPSLFTTQEYDVSYGLFNANCEHFATYCKTGKAFCQQSAWLIDRIKEVVSSCKLKAAAQMVGLSVELLLVTLAEIVENLGGMTEFIGFFAVFITQIISLYLCRNKLKQRLNDGDITKDTYQEELILKISECVCAILIAGVGGVLLACLVPLGLMMEILLCPILIIGGQAVGRLLGYVINNFGTIVKKAWNCVELGLTRAKKLVVEFIEGVTDYVAHGVQVLQEVIETCIEKPLLRIVQCIRSYFLLWFW